MLRVKSPNPIQNKKMIFPQEQNRPTHFHINSTRVVKPVKRNKLSFSSIEINKPLPAPVCSFFKARFKFRSQLQSLPQTIHALTQSREQIATYSNITDNIVRKVTDVQQKKCRTKKGPLGNTSISRIFLERLSIQNHSKPSFTKKRRNKAKCMTRNSIRLKFVKMTSMLKALDVSIAIARVAPDLLKAPVVLSDITVGRFAIDREDLKPY